MSARTVASVSMIEKGLQRLYTNLEKFDYENTLKLLSCMTLDVENCHATVHVKQANMSMAEYCRSFGLAMKEAVKRVTSWADSTTQAGDLGTPNQRVLCNYRRFLS